MGQVDTASMAIAEMREFAEFDACEQRYIRRSLDIGLVRADAFARWASDDAETASIRRQYLAYQELKPLRAALKDARRANDGDPHLAPLIRLAAFDLKEDSLLGFPAFRFLYERLLGPEARPWLPAAFCAAAALPQIVPDRRKLLLHSISETAACAPGWSRRKPSFFPAFMEEEADA